MSRGFLLWEKKNIGTQIKLLRNLNKKTLVSFAKELGISPSYLSEVENNKKSVSQETIYLLLEKFGINPSWLLTGEGEMFRSQESKQPPANDDYVLIPLFSGFISAGKGTIADDTIETYLSFRKDWIKRKGTPENMSLIRVSGDSMEPTLSTNDIVLIDHSRKNIVKNGIYAIRIDDEIILKRLQPISKNIIQVISDNPKYPPYTIPPSELDIIGKALWYAHEIPE